MKYIVYQTVNKINNKIYIGVHGINDPEVFDGYIGNGVDIYRPSTYKHPKTYFQYAVNKYGPKAFIRTTLQTFDNEESAYKLEEELVNEDFLNRSDVYNLELGGKFHDMCSIKRKVYMYSLSGEFEKEFDGVIDAVHFLDPNAKSGGHLPRAIKNNHQFLGHLFSYNRVDKLVNLGKHLKNREVVESPYSGKKVGRYDDDLNLLETFDTMTDCVKAGYKNAKLVALGKRSHCKGYIFKYLD